MNALRLRVGDRNALLESLRPTRGGIDITRSTSPNAIFAGSRPVRSARNVLAGDGQGGDDGSGEAPGEAEGFSGDMGDMAASMAGFMGTAMGGPIVGGLVEGFADVATTEHDISVAKAIAEKEGVTFVPERTSAYVNALVPFGVIGYSPEEQKDRQIGWEKNIARPRRDVFRNPLHHAVSGGKIGGTVPTGLSDSRKNNPSRTRGAPVGGVANAVSTPQGLADRENNNPSRSRGASPGFGDTAPAGLGDTANNNPSASRGGGPGAGGEGDKIVCTAMNEFYGFGAFRQAIWLRQSRSLHPAYQAGYHAIFRPYVRWAYGPDGPKWARAIGNHIARHRTADIWRQSRGRRDWIGAAERAVLEPLCYLVGRVVLARRKGHGDFSP